MKIKLYALYLMLMIAIQPVAAALSFDQATPAITVSGEAVVMVEPDEILVAFGIETWNEEILQAKSLNQEILGKALESIRGLGVPGERVRTEQIQIQPQYSDRGANRRIEGYFVRNSFTVTLSDPLRLEALMTGALQAGVNHLHGVDFRTSELKKHREKARELALQAAREKAVKMTGALGQSIGPVLRINEGFNGAHWTHFSGWSNWRYGRSQLLSQNVIQNAPGESGSSLDSAALGKISVSASVNVVFALER